jgi:hypothetical protein
MKIRHLLLTIAFLAVAAPSSQAASAVGHISARVLETISVLARTPLIFGYIKPGTSPGTVTITPDNRRIASGNVKLQPGVFERAFFLIRGVPNRSYSIYTPQSLSVRPFELGGPRKPTDTILQARDFTTYSVNARSTAFTGKLDRAGIDRIYLGATLVVPANATPGLYATLVPLTVAY